MAREKGLFVTFDGPNGVGKSTVLRGVAAQFIQLGFDILETKEPTSSPLGEFIRNAEEIYNGRTLACLVAADRYFHLEHEVLPALSEGKIVFTDRYVESSLVLQRFDGVELDFIWKINNQVYIPDLSIILSASSEILEKRLAQRIPHRRFERTISRTIELKYYMEAAEFLSKHGFYIQLLDTSSKLIDENINHIIEQILSIISIKKPHIKKRGPQWKRSNH